MDTYYTMLYDCNGLFLYPRAEMSLTTDPEQKYDPGGDKVLRLNSRRLI